MAKNLSLSGIQTGQAIEAKHVTQSINAFTGAEAYDITVSGSLTVQGPVQGTAGTLNNFSSSYALTASYALNGGSGGGGGGSVGTLQQVMESGSITTLVITASAGISSSGAIISPSFTGSLSGSALESISASFAQTASYVLNAISASFTQTASYVSNAVSSSYALTASHALDAVGFPFSGSAVITGSLVISSSNQEQSLQLYGSGSTIFSIEGSRGTLFSIDDDESDGKLFSVNNVSGTPVLEVHEDNTVKLGKQNGFGIVISGSNPLPNDADAKILITGSIYHSGSSVNFNSFISASSFNAPPGVINQLTASYAISASVEVRKEISSSYADTASYVETAQTASYVLNANNATDLTIQVKNTQTSTILKGQVLHSVGVTGENINVITASNDSAASMPGFAVANQDISSNAAGQAIISGKIKNIDTSGLTAGSNVYVNLNGGYTGTKPTGSSLIQNIGVVGKVNATEGELIILGAGRSNDVPNLLDNQIFFGSGSNQSQQIHISGALDSTIINNITASGNISASGIINGLSGSFESLDVFVNLPVTTGSKFRVGRMDSQCIGFGVGDYDNIILAKQDADSNLPHNFILDRDFEGTGANNFKIQKNGIDQFVIDTSGNITASGNISASGDVITQKIGIVDGAGIGFGANFASGNEASDVQIFTDAAGEINFVKNSTTVLAINSGNNISINPSYFLDQPLNITNNITASGNISASGYISASNLGISGSATIDGPLTLTQANTSNPLTINNGTGTEIYFPGTTETNIISQGLFQFKTSNNQGYGFGVNGIDFKAVIGAEGLATTSTTVIADTYNGRLILRGNASPNQITGSIVMTGSAGVEAFISASSFNATPGTINELTASYAMTASTAESILPSINFKPVVTHTSNFTSTSSYAGHYNIVGGTLAITVTTGSTPTDLTPGMEWDFFQTSSGDSFTFTEGTGVEIISRNSNKRLAAVGSAGTLKYISGQTFHLIGDLTI